MKKYARQIAAGLLLILLAGILTGCGEPDTPAQASPYESTVTAGDFEYTFYMSDSVYRTGSREELTCRLEICYVGSGETVTLDHASRPYMLSLEPYPDGWGDGGVQDIGASTVLERGKPAVYTDTFPWDPGKIPAGEYTLTVWVDFSVDGQPTRDCVFEVPLTVRKK